MPAMPDDLRYSHAEMQKDFHELKIIQTNRKNFAPRGNKRTVLIRFRSIHDVKDLMDKLSWIYDTFQLENEKEALAKLPVKVKPKPKPKKQK